MVYIMERFFNTAGPVDPEIHYCIDPLKRIDLPEVVRLIDQRKYFVLHAPRQTGKTSALFALAKKLNHEGRFLCSYVNVESAQTSRNDVITGMRTIVADLARLASFYCGDPWPSENWRRVADEQGPGALGALLAQWSQASAKPIVLLIDEIDSLVGDTLVAVLRQIRSGYSQRPAAFPQSIVLCGVRDVRDYRIKQEGREVITGGSAFNIKAESLRVGDFSAKETGDLLCQHTSATGQVFEDAAIENVYALTNGQPWLVNALAYELCFRDKEGRNRSTRISPAMVDAAKEVLILRRDTHIDQLIDKLHEARVRKVIEPLLAGRKITTTVSTDDRQYVEDLGLIRRSGQGVVIANPIYQEVIPRELTWMIQENIQSLVQQQWYVDPKTGRLLMDKLIAAFQQFFRENAGAWLEKFDYKEAGPQLLLQAFLQRIVNGNGTIAREYGLGRQRVDLCVFWPLPGGALQKEVLELKLLRKSLQSTVADGMAQTAEYMDACGVCAGHLLIFDRSTKKPWSRKIFRRKKTVDRKTVMVWGM